MLDRADKYKYVDVGNHRITGVPFKEGIPRWESVAWANEAAAELSVLLGYGTTDQFRNVSDAFVASDIQRVTNRFRRLNEYMSKSTGYVTDWSADSERWRELKSYPPADGTLEAHIDAIVNESTSSLRDVMYGYLRRFRDDIPDVAAGDPLTGDALKALVGSGMSSACPYYEFSVSGGSLMPELSGYVDISTVETYSDTGNTYSRESREPINTIPRVTDPMVGMNIDYSRCPILSAVKNTGQVDYTLTNTSTFKDPLNPVAILPIGAVTWMWSFVFVVAFSETIGQDGGNRRWTATVYYNTPTAFKSNQFDYRNSLHWADVPTSPKNSLPDPGSGYKATGVIGPFDAGGACQVNLNCCLGR